MASAFTALFDACVLYPFVLRDVLVQMSTTDLFRGRWSPHIHEEWMGAVVKRGVMTREQAERIRRLMDESSDDAVVTGYDGLIETIKLPHAGDRHVVAAAIVARANVIVTRNLRHFPPDALRKYRVEAVHPDEFIVHQIELDPALVCESIRTARLRLQRRPYDVTGYLELLQRQDLPRTVARLAPYAELL